MKPLVVIDFYCAVHRIIDCSDDPDMIKLYWNGLLSNYVDYDVVVVSDIKPYWRSLVYPNYKGNRPKNKKENFALVEEIGREVFPDILQMEGLEADDWAGLIVRYHNQKRTRPKVELRTVDTDWLQLVSDTVIWSNYGHHLPQYRGIQEAIEWTYSKLNVFIQNPSDIARVKYLLGDPVDNIPPELPTDLVSLSSDAWLKSLEVAGYDIDELTNIIAKHYD